MPKGYILIIDDEDKRRQLLARIHELEGYHIYQASNAHTGLDLLTQHPDVSLVITDVKLPDANGLVCSKR